MKVKIMYKTNLHHFLWKRVSTVNRGVFKPCVIICTKKCVNQFAYKFVTLRASGRGEHVFLTFPFPSHSV